MKTTARLTNWTRYAEKYDMLLAHNPFYQALHQQVLDFTAVWKIDRGDLIADLGAGTGNYSTALARQFPQAKVIHVDKDVGMNEVAQAKKLQFELPNLQLFTKDSKQLDFQKNSLKACLCIHFLYTLEDPEALLRKIYDWLMPNGYGIFVDPGRIVNVLNWQIAIGSRMLLQYGPWKTLRIIADSKTISQQNRKISQLQANGTYWTHSHEAFCAAVKNAGFKVLDAGITFRKISDWVVVTKS